MCGGGAICISVHTPNSWGLVSLCCPRDLRITFMFTLHRARSQVDLPSWYVTMQPCAQANSTSYPQRDRNTAKGVLCAREGNRRCGVALVVCVTYYVVNQPKLIRGQWPKEWRIAPRLHRSMAKFTIKGKYKGFPFSTPSVGPGADPGVQAVSPQETVSHPPGGRLVLISARPVVTFPAAEHHHPSAGTKLYCLVTEAHRCEQLAQG